MYDSSCHTFAPATESVTLQNAMQPYGDTSLARAVNVTLLPDNQFITSNILTLSDRSM